MLNSSFSLLFQIVTILCGFILPKVILSTYGSVINGLVSSITSFLGLISFLEMGVGAVVQSALYKPLADRDIVQTSKIMASAQKFFRHIGQILFVYVILLMGLFPVLVNKNFSWVFTASLIGILSIDAFAEYYFGIVNQLLLNADQRGYVSYITRTVTLLINTAACLVLAKMNASIHVLKLTTSLIFLARPCVYRYFVSRSYQLDRKIQYTGEPIQQKWNGAAQHLAAVVLANTDQIVLSLFSSLQNVSVYYVYSMVISNVKALLVSSTNGIQALMGELWAKKETEELNRMFGLVEWGIHNATLLIFGCTAVLTTPFVMVYTKGITDQNYFQPLFSLLLTLAHCGHCLRLPYNLMILAGGHYKQTQHSYVIAAVGNVVISVILVRSLGLVGVAIGTIITMGYQTVWMAWYISRNLICWPFVSFLKQMTLDAVTFAAAYFVSQLCITPCSGYVEWVILGIKIAFVWGAIVVAVNFMFKRSYLITVWRVVRNKLVKKME